MYASEYLLNPLRWTVGKPLQRTTVEKVPCGECHTTVHTVAGNLVRQDICIKVDAIALLKGN